MKQCPICKGNLILDDREVNFDGNYNNYYICESCNRGFVYHYRYHKLFKIVDDDDKILYKDTSMFPKKK